MQGPATDRRSDREGEFSEFFAASWARLYRIALGVAGDPGTAEDGLQAAFAKAYAAWPRVRRADHPEAYVRRMVLNELLGSRRYGFGRRERPCDELTSTGSVDSPEVDVVRRDAIGSALRALPPRQRAVVVLRYYADLSEEQIADTLGCSRGTVKSQASAALATLRREAAHFDLIPDPVMEQR